MHDGAEQQYYVTLKFANYKGISGAMWNIFRYYLIGLVGTFLLLAYLKRIGHDSANYYNVKYVLMEGKPGYTPGIYPAVINSVRGYQNKYLDQDVLGRSNYFVLI